MITFHSAQITKGKLKLSKKDQYREMNKNLPDGPYVVIVMSMNTKDTRDCQNRYFAQLGEWSQDVGESKVFLHDMVKDELFTSLFGESLSTNDLTSEQWTMVFFNLENFLLRKYDNK